MSYKTGQLEDKHDLTPALKFGELVYLLDSTSGRPSVASFQYDLSSLTDQLYNARIQPDDVLLPMGAPTLIAAAAAIWSESTGGILSMLQWDHRQSDYVLMRGCVICPDPRCTGHQ